MLISKVSIDSVISHDEFVLINNALQECDDVKGKSKILMISMFEILKEILISEKQFIKWN